MILSLHAQAQLFLLTVLLGGGMGLFYDGLRVFRHALRHNAFWVQAEDGLFWLLAVFLVFCVMLHANAGEIRFFTILGLFGGMGLYFLTLSPLMLRVFRGLFRLLGRILQTLFAPVRFFLKFLKKISKTLFARCRKWFTITCKHFFDWKHAQLERSRRRNEICQVVSDRQAGDSDPRCICHRYPGAPARADPRQRRRGAGADKLHRKHTAGK